MHEVMRLTTSAVPMAVAGIAVAAGRRDVNKMQRS
jgi:hypothetical protein